MTHREASSSTVACSGPSQPCSATSVSNATSSWRCGPGRSWRRVSSIAGTVSLLGETDASGVTVSCGGQSVVTGPDGRGLGVLARGLPEIAPLREPEGVLLGQLTALAGLGRHVCSAYRVGQPPVFGQHLHKRGIGVGLLGGAWCGLLIGGDRCLRSAVNEGYLLEELSLWSSGLLSHRSCSPKPVSRGQ